MGAHAPAPGDGVDGEERDLVAQGPRARLPHVFAQLLVGALEAEEEPQRAPLRQPHGEEPGPGRGDPHPAPDASGQERLAPDPPHHDAHDLAVQDRDPRIARSLQALVQIDLQG